jgi:hypothetical protein
MNVTIFCDTVPFNPYVNQHFEGIYHYYLQSRKSAEAGGHGDSAYLPAARYFLTRLVSTVKIEVTYSSETSIHVRAKRALYAKLQYSLFCYSVILFVKVPGCKHRGPGFDSRGYQIF